jgi:hypothetical protein
MLSRLKKAKMSFTAKLLKKQRKRVSEGHINGKDSRRISRGV